MRTEQLLNMDSTDIDGVETQTDSKKTSSNFPLSFLDFLNSKTVDKNKSKTNYDDDQSKGFTTQSYLKNDKNDKETAISSLIGKETSTTNIYDGDQSKGFTTQGYLEKDKEKTAISLVDKETSDLDDVTLSDDEFLPTCRSLFDRIKRHTSDDNLFKCSPGNAMPDSKLKSIFYDDNGTSASQNEIDCESDDDKTKATSLAVKVTNHVLQSDGGRNEEEDVSETPTEIQLADLQRICYKAMIFQQTGQVPVDCDGYTTESCSSCVERDPRAKNPCPCLCRFYCKKKRKKGQAKLSLKGPCRIGKGYASDKRNQRHSSCACKILPNSKVAKQTFQTEVGESSSIKSVGVIEENSTLRNQKRAGKIKEPNSQEEIAKKYLHDFTAKTRLLAKLELSEKRLKRLASYNASLPSFSGLVPVDGDGMQDASIISLSEDDSIDEQKENITDLNRIENLGAVIDLTADSPSKSPILAGSHQFNQLIAKSKLEFGIKAEPEGEMALQTNRIHKPTVGRYGVAMGAIYTSKTDPEEEMLLQTNRRHKPTVGCYGVTMGAVYTLHSNDDGDMLNDYEKERETSRKLSKETLKNSQKSTYICDSDEDSRPNIPNSVTSKHLPKKESGASDQIGVSNDQWLYHPVTSCSKDDLPVSEQNYNPQSTAVHNVGYPDLTIINGVSTFVLHADESTSHSELEWNTHSSGTTYADLLASYAAYDSDYDDRMSFTMGSPEGSECLDNEDPVVPIKIGTTESEHEPSAVEIHDMLTSQPSTSAVPDIPLPTNRALRPRTIPRITQTMMLKKGKARRQLINPTLPQTPVNNASASDQAISKQRGRPRKKSCLQLPDEMDNSVKKAKVAVETGSVDGNDESTPERAQLKLKITAMASQLKQVSVLTARAAELEKLALDAKHKESLAMQKAHEASEKLKEERLERIKLLKEAEEKAKVEKAEEERKAKELEKEKERAASEARAKAWECPVCFEPRTASTQLSVTPCGHVFCKPCIMEVGLSHGHCPLCNQAFTKAQACQGTFHAKLDHFTQQETTSRYREIQLRIPLK